MSKSAKKKKSKVPTMTEEQYAEYVMAMKDETPVDGYSECAEGNHGTPHVGADHHGRK